MSDTPTNDAPIMFEVEKLGTVVMVGTGPWRIRENGSSREIMDSDNRVANPTLIHAFGGNGRGQKASRNQTFASADKARTIVDKANELLAAR